MSYGSIILLKDAEIRSHSILDKFAAATQGRVKSAASLSSSRSDHRWASEIHARIGRQTRTQDQLGSPVNFCRRHARRRGE